MSYRPLIFAVINAKYLRSDASIFFAYEASILRKKVET